MLKETKIGDNVFLEQTTYYCYRNEKDRKKDIAFCVTSDKRVLNDFKRQARNIKRRKIK